MKLLAQEGLFTSLIKRFQNVLQDKYMSVFIFLVLDELPK